MIYKMYHYRICSTPLSRKDHVVISSFAFVLLEVKVEEVALDTHFRVMEVPKQHRKNHPENHRKSPKNFTIDTHFRVMEVPKYH